jgi:BirA family biotin operon repressor/biotin-[acetyl-CoA-carboxylase] ligase
MNAAQQTPFEYRLLETRGGVPGKFLEIGNLAAELQVTARDVDNALRNLKRLGFPVTVRSDGQVALEPGVDVLDSKRVAKRIGCSLPGWDIYCHLEVGSTNDLAMEAARSGAPHGTVFVAEHQTRGRGRLGRKWFSPPGSGLWFSVVLRQVLPVSKAWMLTLGAGSAIVAAVASTYGVALDLKWPNDVRYEGCKLGGILTEASPTKDMIEFAVLGIGLNVNQDARDFPSDLSAHVASLRQATGERVSRSELLVAILKSLDETLSDLEPEKIRNDWLGNTRMMGSRVSATVDQSSLVGIAEDLSPEGALVVRDSAGKIHHIQSGEVQQLRDEVPSGQRLRDVDCV